MQWLGFPGGSDGKEPALNAGDLGSVPGSGRSLGVVVQCLSHVRLFATPWTAARQASLSTVNSQSLLKFMSIESVMPFNNLILCRPHLLPPSIFPAPESFQISQFFASGGQNIGVSA